MKNIFWLILLIPFLSCKNSDNQSLTENEIYNLINNFIIQDLKKTDSDTLIFEIRKLKSPPQDFIPENFDEIPIVKMEPTTPFPILTKNQWNTNKIKDILFITKTDYIKYLVKDNGFQKEWNEKYGSRIIYNISNPIYNQKSKIAIIKVFPIKPYTIGHPKPELFYYEKTKKGWMKK